jgi:hypothetical protein
MASPEKEINEGGAQGSAEDKDIVKQAAEDFPDIPSDDEASSFSEEEPVEQADDSAASEQPSIEAEADSKAEAESAEQQPEEEKAEAEPTEQKAGEEQVEKIDDSVSSQQPSTQVEVEAEAEPATPKAEEAAQPEVDVDAKPKWDTSSSGSGFFTQRYEAVEVAFSVWLRTHCLSSLQTMLDTMTVIKDQKTEKEKYPEHIEALREAVSELENHFCTTMDYPQATEIDEVNPMGIPKRDFQD